MPVTPGTPLGLTRGLYQGQHSALGSVQCQPQVPESAAEGYMGDIPYHDVLYPYPVLPGHKIGHSVCAQHGRLAQSYHHPSVTRKAGGPEGTGVEGPGAVSILQPLLGLGQLRPTTDRPGRGQL